MSAAKEFLHQFYPKILDVPHRSTSYWETVGFRVIRPTTNLFNLAFIYAGEGTIELNHEGYDLKPGCMFHVSPRIRMDIASSQENPLQYYGVHFHQLRIQWEGTDCQTSFSDTPLPFRRVISLPGYALHDQAASLYRLWQSKETGYDWSAKLALFRIMDGLCDVVISEQRGQERTYRQMESSVLFIREHYAEPLSREVLAEQAYMSVSHYSALFKSMLGISPLQFVEKVRIDHAKTLLTGTSKPIGEIAKLIGYNDPLYFTRVFTKVTGMSPREYRGA
ncbi:AraC family transcriptional regulator [Paenibacillus sp. UNC451MF]|uniref:AraC family transcriptional regulator n=1 Tax=Paenibacillus sp. UNC451MF TaxID=1449063 RepID=UPI00048C109D|nr:AraC family transcriptional regulator [Paenibacillus sp. UNC451MF]